MSDGVDVPHGMSSAMDIFVRGQDFAEWLELAPRHKTLAMVLRYTHLSDDHIDQAVAKLDSAFSDAITPELNTSADQKNRGAA